MGVDAADLDFLRRHCPPGICRRTGQLHVHLRGAAADERRRMTEIAAEYPAQLCHALVKALAMTVQAHGFNTLA